MNLEIGDRCIQRWIVAFAAVATSSTDRARAAIFIKSPPWPHYRPRTQGGNCRQVGRQCPCRPYGIVSICFYLSLLSSLFLSLDCCGWTLCTQLTSLGCNLSRSRSAVTRRSRQPQVPTIVVGRFGFVSSAQFVFLCRTCVYSCFQTASTSIFTRTPFQPYPAFFTPFFIRVYNGVGL